MPAGQARVLGEGGMRAGQARVLGEGGMHAGQARVLGWRHARGTVGQARAWQVDCDLGVQQARGGQEWWE